MLSLIERQVPALIKEDKAVSKNKPVKKKEEEEEEEEPEEEEEW